LRCGEPATRRTEITKTAGKQGRSGPMTLVTVRHLITQRGHVVVHEEQDIVYRTPAPLALPEAEHVPDQPDDWQVDTTPPLLFRYSALTYNAHRIHYDRDYARDVEGYPGLVVHGPLQAMLMTEWVRRNKAAAARRVEFRLVAPAFDFDGLLVGAGVPARDNAPDVIVTSVRTRHGRPTATALFTLAT
jgi:3-methylfumaryl-CoA hydratase